MIDVGLPVPPGAFDPLPVAGTALTKAAIAPVLDGVVSYLTSGTRSVVTAMASLIGRTSPDLGRTWFAGHVAAMAALVGLLLVPMLAAATIGAVLRQDMARLARTWGVFLPLAVVGGGLTIPLTSEALTVTDAMSNALTYHLGTDLTAAVRRIGVVVVEAATSGPVLAALLALVVVAGSLMVWVELLVRSAAIYVAVFFLPLALAGLVWPATSHWARRCIHLLVALLLSKFVIVGAITVGIGALSAGGNGPPDQALMGGAVLLMAAFAPFLLLRLVPVVEAAAIAHLEGTSRRPIHALRGAAATAAVGVNNPLTAALAGARTAPGARTAADTPVVPRDLATVGNEVDAAYAAVAAGEAEKGDGGGDER